MKLGELFDVTDLITVVTGSASGIGCAHAEAMAHNGGDPSKIEMADRRVEMGAAERRPRNSRTAMRMRAIHLDVAEVALVPLRLRVIEVAAVLSRSSVAPQVMRPAFCTMAHSRRFSSTVIDAPSAAHRRHISI
jgi:hypothetical protein